MMRRHAMTVRPAACSPLRFRTLRCDRRLNQRRRTPSARSASGFTLIELLMVLSLLIVLTAVSLPGLVRWQRALPLDQATSMLQQQLQETRLVAIQTGQPWRLVLPDSGRSGYREPVPFAASVAQRLASISRSGAGQNRFRQNKSVLRDATAFQWPVGVRCEVLSAGDSNPSVVFQPDGTAVDRQLRLANQHGHSQILQLVRLTGQATVARSGPRRQQTVSNASAR
jgi:Tfp pilus assembly protein FimT